jgi:hypothetical protein
MNAPHTLLSEKPKVNARQCGMSLIQFGGRRGWLWVRLLSHFCGILNGIQKGRGRGDAASQPPSGDKSYLDQAILGRGHNAGRQFYLDNAVHGAVAGNAIEKDDGGGSALGICEAALESVGRGILWIIGQWKSSACEAETFAT